LILPTKGGDGELIRIGGGRAKGRLLKAPRAGRFTLGRVKQTLFDILSWQVPESRFLDIFAGSGAIGIEALSRGAQRAIFIESKAANAALIRENLARCGFEEQADVICAEASRGLELLARKNESFQIIFLDPPYTNPALLERTLEKLALEENLLAPEGMIVVQRAQRAAIKYLPAALQLNDSRRLGDSALDFIVRRR
jgi:16S rRNA (guanine(966)-N(2))-methyltransferase RsmD